MIKIHTAIKQEKLEIVNNGGDGRRCWLEYTLSIWQDLESFNKIWHRMARFNNKFWDVSRSIEMWQEMSGLGRLLIIFGIHFLNVVKFEDGLLPKHLMKCFNIFCLQKVFFCATCFFLHIHFLLHQCICRYIYQYVCVGKKPWFFIFFGLFDVSTIDYYGVHCTIKICYG